MSKKSREKGGMGYRLLHGGANLLALLPFRVLYVFSDFLFILVYYLARYRRKLVKKNLLTFETSEG